MPNKASNQPSLLSLRPTDQPTLSLATNQPTAPERSKELALIAEWREEGRRRRLDPLFFFITAFAPATAPARTVLVPVISSVPWSYHPTQLYSISSHLISAQIVPAYYYLSVCQSTRQSTSARDRPRLSSTYRQATSTRLPSLCSCFPSWASAPIISTSTSTSTSTSPRLPCPLPLHRRLPLPLLTRPLPHLLQRRRLPLYPHTPHRSQRLYKQLP